MQFWQPSLDRTHGPLYLAIADAIGRAIDARELHPGERLPPQRQLATALAVDLTTVTRGYAEAQRRGLIDAVVGRGTFVRGGTWTPEPAGDTASLVDMSMNLPPLPADPSLREMLRAGLDDLLCQADLATLMSYHLGAGSPPDRAAATDWLRPILGQVDPARALVCTGAQCAFTALLMLLTRPGDTILAKKAG